MFRKERYRPKCAKIFRKTYFPRYYFRKMTFCILLLTSTIDLALIFFVYFGANKHANTKTCSYSNKFCRNCNFYLLQFVKNCLRSVGSVFYFTLLENDFEGDLYFQKFKTQRAKIKIVCIEE